MLLDYLIIHDSITGWECINKLGILNYKGRIYDLRKAGYTITRRWETRVNQAGQKKTYARYYLQGVQVNE